VINILVTHVGVTVVTRFLRLGVSCDGDSVFVASYPSLWEEFVPRPMGAVVEKDLATLGRFPYSKAL